MIFPVVVPAATLETGDSTLHRMHTCESGAALAAGIEIFSFQANTFERQIVTPRFVGNPQITAGLSPLATVGSNVAAAGTMLRQKVGKLMAQRSLNFGRRHLDELGIKGDDFGSPAGESRCRSQPRIPLNDYLELGTSCRSQELAAKPFQKDGAS